MGQKSILATGSPALRQLGDWGVANIADSLAVIMIGLLVWEKRAGLGSKEASQSAPARAVSAEVYRMILWRLAASLSQLPRGILRIAPHLHVNEQDLEKLPEC